MTDFITGHRITSDQVTPLINLIIHICYTIVFYYLILHIVYLLLLLSASEVMTVWHHINPIIIII